MLHYTHLALILLLTLSGVLSVLSPPKTAKFKCESNGCCDEHEWCRFWASIGECEANPTWMSTNCQLACNVCEDKAENSAQSGSGNSTSESPVAQTSGECISIRDHPQSASFELVHRHLISPVEDVSARQLLSIDDVTKAVSSGCVPQLKSTDCSRSLCYHLSYRSYDGTCNNLERPLQGAAFRPYRRHLPAEYDDDIGEPISSLRVTRPSAREASRVLLSSAQVVMHDKFNTLLMQWGQFMSHDTAKTTLQPSAPCASCNPVPSRCMPIKISNKDNNMAFQRKRCLKISRSAPICGTGRGKSKREQLNENTAFVDASPLYGSSPKDIHKFRDRKTGFLKMSRFNNQMVLPFDQTKCASKEKCTATFTAGDIRVNLFLGLSSLHILFTREHNRIVIALRRLNPTWSGDRLFQEARKIVGAQVQNILYKEFLPKVLGNSMADVIGPYEGYKPDVDPTISNVFTTSAYRFGHGMLTEFYQRLGASGHNITQGGFTFSEGVFKSGKILFEGGIDPILRGLIMSPVKRPHRMTPSITERMFGSTDLGSVNIQRGRDHGLPSYNKWRVFCGMKTAHDFEGLSNEILDKNIRDGLARSYKTPNDVDLYVGSMVEDPVIGGLVGQTLACLIGDQFKRLRDGDRFYFENPGIFTADQVTELKKSSLSRVICTNADNFETISEDAFLLPHGATTPCTQIPQIDLTKWKE